MENVLTRKLERFATLSRKDRILLDDVVTSSRTVDSRRDLVHEGEPTDVVSLVVDGMACRYKVLADGRRRQIVAYLVPGDLCDLNVSLLSAMDHSVATVSRCTVVDIPRRRIVEMTARPGLERAFKLVTLVDEGTLREWLFNMGRRPVDERVSHLFCELFARMRAVGFVDGNRCAFPLVQEDIADTMGLSTVHVNRCLKRLRGMGLASMGKGFLTMIDEPGIVEFCRFNPNYLHLDQPGGGEAAGPGSLTQA